MYARPCDEIAQFDESKIVAGSSSAGPIQHITALPGMFICVSGGEPDLPQMIQVREQTKESMGTVLMTLPWVGNIIWMTGIAPSALLAAMEDGQVRISCTTSTPSLLALIVQLLCHLRSCCTTSTPTLPTTLLKRLILV